jgi:hypothetical protein
MDAVGMTRAMHAYERATRNNLDELGSLAETFMGMFGPTPLAQDLVRICRQSRANLDELRATHTQFVFDQADQASQSLFGPLQVLAEGLGGEKE